jgi:hypothetical protein
MGNPHADVQKAIAEMPRCGAWGRTAGPSMSPGVPVPGRTRCYLHGGRNRGPKLGSQHNLVHGKYSAAEVEGRRQKKAEARAAKAQIDSAIKQADRISKPRKKPGPRPKVHRGAP